MFDVLLALIKLSVLAVFVAGGFGILLGLGKIVFRLGHRSFHGLHDLALGWGERLLEEGVDVLVHLAPTWRPTRGLLIEKIHEQERAIRDLRLDLAAMVGRAAGLDSLVTDLRRRLEGAENQGERHPLYACVGLDASAPDFLVKAARREFRKNLHPDTRPPAQRADATRRFQEAENAFSKIFRARGWAG